MLLPYWTRHLIQALVGEDEIVLAVPEIDDGQRDAVLDALVGLEGAVAVAGQDEDVAVGVADEQVEVAVGSAAAGPGDVGDGDAGRIVAGRVGGEEGEIAVAVAEVDVDEIVLSGSRMARSRMPLLA